MNHKVLALTIIENGLLGGVDYWREQTVCSMSLFPPSNDFMRHTLQVVKSQY